MFLKRINKFYWQILEQFENFNNSFWGAIFLLTLLLFYQYAWVPGFFHDGHLYASFGKTIAETNNFWAPGMSQDLSIVAPHHPPLVFILEGFFFKVFGSSWQSIRIFFGLFIFLSLIFLYRMFKAEGKLSWGKLALLFFILLPPLFKKTRSPNLDIPLMTFILGSLSFYFLSFKNHFSKKYWFLSGLFFGLALLTKGIPALIIPGIIFIHLILTKKIVKVLTSGTPYISVIMGLAIGLIWPIMLFLKGHENIFDSYVNGQFVSTVVEGRGEHDFKLWTYPYYLLENAGPWFILSLIGIYQILRKKYFNDLSLLFLSIFIMILVPFSFVRWKYSNYIVPSFPAIAALAAIPLIALFEKYQTGIKKGVRGLTIFALFILLIFPITNKTKRDQELFLVTDSLKTLSLDHKTPNWVLYEESYPYHNLFNFIGFNRLGTLTVIKNGENLEKRVIEIGSSYLFLPYHLYLEHKNFFNNCDKVAYFPQKNLIVLFHPSDEYHQKEPS